MTAPDQIPERNRTKLRVMLAEVFCVVALVYGVSPVITNFDSPGAKTS
jgi:hypothetical protein